MTWGKISFTLTLLIAVITLNGVQYFGWSFRLPELSSRDKFLTESHFRLLLQIP